MSSIFLVVYLMAVAEVQDKWLTIIEYPVEGLVGIYCQLIPDCIESTRAQIFSRQIQSGDTEPNSKYSLKKYFQIV